MAPSTALATKAPSLITTNEQYTSAMAEWTKNYTVLTPFTNILGLAPSYALVASVVKLDTDATKGEVYAGLPWLAKNKPNADDNEVAPAKIGLRKMAENGSISTDADEINTGAKYHWKFKGIATYRGLDGTIIRRTATAEWDLRDGSDRLKGWTPNQITEGRKNGLRNCEARAINAAIRECGCGIKQKYTVGELKKPFLVIRVAFQPDMSDPETKRQVTAAALGSTNTLYAGGPSRSVDHETQDDETPDATPRHVGSGQTAAATAPTTDEPPTPEAVRIVKVEEKSGVGKNNKPFTRYLVVDSTGLESSTFDKKLYEAAVKYRDARAWVEIATEANGSYTNLIEISPAGEQPKLPGTEDL